MLEPDATKDQIVASQCVCYEIMDVHEVYGKLLADSQMPEDRRSVILKEERDGTKGLTR